MIHGTSGNDVIFGYGGNDTIYGKGGHDVIFGGNGNDTIYGDNGADVLCGEAGNDTLFGNAGNDWIRGHNGADFIRGGNHADTIQGDAGVDDIHGEDGWDVIFGGDHGDLILGGKGNDSIDGGPGHDTIEAMYQDDLVFGGSGDDVLKGGNDHDQLIGNAGNDTIYGMKGNDTLWGSAGTDILSGGPDNDTLVGGGQTGDTASDGDETLADAPPPPTTTTTTTVAPTTTTTVAPTTTTTTPITVPVVPSCTYWVSDAANPTATAPNIVDVNWEPAVGVDGYVIERSVDGGAWTVSAAEPDSTITQLYDEPPAAGDITGYRMYAEIASFSSDITECVIEALPGNIVTPQRPFFPETDTHEFGDIGHDPALTAAQNEAAIQTAYNESCVALQDSIPVVSSGTRFQGISDSTDAGSNPFYIPRGGTVTNNAMAYTWVPDGWQMRGIGQIDLIEAYRHIQNEPEVQFTVTPGFVSTFVGPDQLAPQSFDSTGGGLDFAWTWTNDTIGHIPHKDYASDLYDEVGGQYQMIGIVHGLGGGRYGYDFTITVEPKPVAPGATVAPWVPEPCRIYEEIVSIPMNNSIWDIDLMFKLYQLLEFMESFNTGCLNAAKDFIAGIIANLHQLVGFVDDPGGFIATKANEIKTAIEAAANNPDQAFKDLIQWDLLQQNPAQWLGEVGCSLLIDIILGATAAKILQRVDDFVRQNKRKADGDDPVDNDDDMLVDPPPCTTNSFPTGTPVLMGDGSRRAIDQIVIGDEVVAHDVGTGSWTKRIVLDQWSHVDTDDVVSINFTDGSSVSATDHHLFLLDAGNWARAEDLQAGDLLVGAQNSPTVAEVVHWPTGSNLVWELTVDSDHTFTVYTGTADVVVHNAIACSTTDGNGNITNHNDDGTTDYIDNQGNEYSDVHLDENAEPVVDVNGVPKPALPEGHVDWLVDDHAFLDHKDDWPGVETKEEMVDAIVDAVDQSDRFGFREDGTRWWYDSDSNVVIYDNAPPDVGTAFYVTQPGYTLPNGDVVGP